MFGGEGPKLPGMMGAFDYDIYLQPGGKARS
jgi:hypothetical protein